MRHEPQVSEDEIPCDFSSIMDCADLPPPAPAFTGNDPAALKGMEVGNDYEPRPPTFLEQYLLENPGVTFTRESVIKGMTQYLVDQMGEAPLRQALQEVQDRWAKVGTATMPDPTTIVEDPCGDMIRHFAIFYEHVTLLEGYPKEAQPQLKELKLLGTRIHKCLVNTDGTLNADNVKRAENADMTVTMLDISGEKDQSKNGRFIQVTRGKAILRQRV